MNTSIAIILDTRKSKVNGTYPLKLRVTHNRVYKKYGIGIDLNLSDWEKLNGSRAISKLSKAKEVRDAALEKAQSVVDSIPQFSFEAFEKKFNSAKTDKNSVFEAYKAYIDELKAADRIGTSLAYNDSLQSLMRFKKTLSFQDVTPSFLNEYEAWMKKQNRSMTTVGIYLRCLRKLINDAIEDGVIPLSAYPFGKRKYQTPAGRNIKKAITVDEVGLIYNYECIPDTPEHRAKSFWIFSYLCNGMNMQDVCSLKYSNIKGNKLEFTREKTKLTKKSDAKTISIMLTDEIKEIISLYGNEEKKADNYIFPILYESISPVDQKKKVHQFIKTVNMYMKRIAFTLRIDNSLTTYSARHSFSTVLKRSGASTEFISESLGHSDVKTTQSYLDSFEDSVKLEYSKALTAFKKV